MNKREYAEAIAREINGAEVREVEKANGVVFTGISITVGNVSPTAYIDYFYDNNVPVSDATEKIKSAFNDSQKQIDVSWICDYEKVKPRLQARLYNQKTKAEVFRPATEYGFDDIIIIPYISIEMEDGNGAAQVRESHLKQWGVTATEVIDTAIKNLQYEQKIISMTEFLLSMLFKGDAPETPDCFEDPIVIVTNKTLCYGASSILTVTKELQKRFPDGYVVIPSSVNECIVIGECEDMELQLENVTQMVREVNASEVKPEEVLSDHAYYFKGKGVE